MSLKIGADPELFCFDTDIQDYISAHTFFPGTKADPFPVKDGALQLDGLAAELNIDPVTTDEDFVRVLRSVIDAARTFLPPKVVLMAKPSVVFNKTHYASIPERNKELGCTPDFCAWTDGNQNVIKPADTPSLRAAGGHIHVGFLDNLIEDPFSDAHMDLCCEVVKQLDYLVGLQTTIWDNDNQRRLLYGKAGAFRPKKYGVEYRTPSNDWLSSEDKMKTVFNLTKKAYEDFDNGKVYNNLFRFFNVEEIINTGDKVKAEGALNAVLVA